MTQAVRTIVIVMLAGILVSGCGGTFGNKSVDYRSAKTRPVLEIPPDLSSLPADNALPASGGTRTALYSRQGGKADTTVVALSRKLLPEFEGVRLRRSGDIRWLEVKLPPKTMWNKAREFILSLGLIINKEIPAAGLIETDWAENRANVGTRSQKAFSKWFRSIFNTGTRDKFRVRIEKTDNPNITDVYISHQGMKEVVSSGNDGVIGLATVETMWQPRPSDRSLEMELMRLLMVHIGIHKEDAKKVIAKGTEKPVIRAQLDKDKDGYVLISLAEHLDRAWRRVGISIDRIGFTVEDQDRSRGIYYIRYIDPKYIGRKKKRKRKRNKNQEQYQIRVQSQDSGTQVAVLDKTGALEKSKTSKRILSLLYEQLK